MKRMKKYLWLSFVIVIGCLFFFGKEAEAAKVDFYKRFESGVSDFVDYDFKLNCKCKMTVTMETFAEEDPDDEYYEWENSLLVAIYDESDDELLEIEVNGRDWEKEVLTLPAGKYNLWIESDVPYAVTLSGKYIPELSAKSLKLEAGKSKALKVKGASGNISWKSSKNSVASVNNQGVVKAKKAGKATITAKCEGYTLKCNVTVTKKPPTYNEVSKKMKAFAKKNKNYFVFKTIDAGKKCRLYAGGISAVDTKKAESEGYASGASAQPYIELVKKNGKAEMRLIVHGYMVEHSISPTTLGCRTMKFSTSNRKLSFPMTSIFNKNRYDYSKYFYKGEMRGYSTVSTSAKKNTSNLNKFDTMLGQKLKISIVSSDGFRFTMGFQTSSRKNWRKLVKEYKVLLKKF